MLESEAALLKAIGPALQVRTPHPEFVARSPVAPDIALMIYRRIPGLSLDDIALDDALVAGIAAELARFLDGLHGLSPGLLDALEIPRLTPDGWIKRHQMLYRRTRDAVRRGLGATEFERYEAWWCDYLTTPEYRAFEPRLILGDLAPEHVLIEMEPWRLSGIIDFGDAMWADPALDLAGLPDLLARAVVTEMQSITPDRIFWARRDAYRWIAPLHAVFAGLESDRPVLLRGGIDALRRIFGQLETSP
jgi:aminoglycoside phosphotransferase (APT) family kinase protein